MQQAKEQNYCIPLHKSFVKMKCVNERASKSLMGI